jgi:hypothetical protein
MPSPGHSARVIRDFSRTFPLISFSPQEWHCRPQRNPHFHSSGVQLWTRAGPPAGGVASDWSHPEKAKGPRKYELQGPFC